MEIREAKGFADRLRGLAFREPVEHALLFPRTRAVHTLGMRYALDLIWLGPDGAPVRVDRGVAPWRHRSCRSARAVVECEAGQADAVLDALRSSE